MDSSLAEKPDERTEAKVAQENVLAKPEEEPAATEHETKEKSANGGGKQDEERQYPKGIKLILLSLSLMLAVFIMALDNTIISTAVPKMTTRFRSIDDIGWYTAAYLLPLMSLQPTFGKIYSFFRVKPIFLGAMVTFEIGSIICAASPSSGIFILGRVISGIGAAAIYAGGMVIITSAVPLNRISIYLASFSSMWAIANASGPPLGGVFTDSKALTWRFCFWVNLPFGFLAVLAFLCFFKEPKRPASQLSHKQLLTQMDLAGTGLFVSCIVLLFVALQLGGSEFSWSNGRVIASFVLSGSCLVAFVFLQRFLKERATIPPHVFLNRSVVASVMVAALMSLSVNTHTFYLPFYFQSAKGTSASGSGLRLIPYTISLTATELVVGAGSSFLGLFLPFMYAGTSLFTVAAGLLCTIQVDTGTSKLIGYQILAGIGIGSSMQLCATSVRAAVKDADIPIAATLSIFAPFFGSSIGAAVAQNVFRIVLKQQLLHFLPSSEAIAVIEAGGTGIDRVTNVQTKGFVKEAYRFALSRVFIIPAVAGGIAFIGTLCIKWRTLKTKADSTPKGGPTEDAGEKRG